MKPPDVFRKNWINASLRDAQILGYLEDNREIELSGRVPSKLLKAARLRTGIRDNKKLLVLALSLLAIHDDFGERFLGREGSVDPTLKLDL